MRISQITLFHASCVLGSMVRGSTRNEIEDAGDVLTSTKTRPFQPHLRETRLAQITKSRDTLMELVEDISYVHSSSVQTHHPER